MNQHWERKRLTDIATVEMAKPDKVYPAGTICVPLSAYSRGAIYQLGEATSVGGRYACVIPHDLTECDYFYTALQLSVGEFESKFVTGINIQMPIFEKHFTIQWHTDETTRKVLQQPLSLISKQEEIVERQINRMKEVKTYYLDKLFVSD